MSGPRCDGTINPFPSTSQYSDNLLRVLIKAGFLWLWQRRHAAVPRRGFATYLSCVHLDKDNDVALARSGRQKTDYGLEVVALSQSGLSKP